jgi:hypothetical protein
VICIGGDTLAVSLPELRNSKELLVVHHLPKLVLWSIYIYFIAPAAGLLIGMFSSALELFFCVDFADVFYEKCGKRKGDKKKIKGNWISSAGLLIDNTYSFGANPS